MTTLLERAPAEEARKAIALAGVRLRHLQAVTASWHPYPHQIAPAGFWKVWALIAGRGAGKTDAGAHYVDQHAQSPACLEGPVPHRIAIIAPTLPDAQQTCVLGDSGLLSANPALAYRPGSMKQADVVWPNGAQARLFGAHGPDDPNRLRGPQHCLVWAEELAAWSRLDDTWDMMEFGLRLGPDPRAIVTTTPRPRPLIKRLMADATTVVSRAKTSDNPSLPADRKAALYARYAGTRLGRQELDAEIIDDVDGALWTREMIQYRPVPLIHMGGVNVPNLTRVVVGVDPAVTFGEDSDETGIVVDGLGSDGNGYTLADVSGRYSPTEWARTAVAAYHEWKADRIVAEANNGGELVRTVIAQVDPKVPVTLVHASKGKTTRAEPVSTLYIPSEHRRLRWFHTQPFPELEDQMCNYLGLPNEDSPDRMDAHVWGATELAHLAAGDGWGSGQSWGTGKAVVTA